MNTVPHVPQAPVAHGFQAVQVDLSKPNLLRETATDLSVVLCVEGGVVLAIFCLALVVFTR